MSTTATAPENADMAAFWNGASTRAWAEGYDRIDAMFAPVTACLFEAETPREGERVIDIGCGSGTTVLGWAELVGKGGHVLGVDIAEASVAQARARIAAAGLSQAEMALGDLTVMPLPPVAFDLAVSRFGVMFFSDPVASFRNLHSAMAPTGRLTFAVFRHPRENPFATAPIGTVRHLLPDDAIAPYVPNAPGQFGWADADHVRSILDGAGFRDVMLTPRDLAMRLGPPGGAAAAADQSMRMGPLARLGSDLSGDIKTTVHAALTAFFAGHDGPDGITLPGAIWIVQARV